MRITCHVMGDIHITPHMMGNIHTYYMPRDG